MTEPRSSGSQPVVGVTILLPTFNRAEPLRETLSGLASVDYTGIDCEIVVIDNNSTDATPDVVKTFRDRLPVLYLRETRVGKNMALNKALRECALKDLVLFTDDDVTPDRNWLQQVVEISERWPEIGVFGGRIDVSWPGEKPDWAEAEWIRAFGYSAHDLGDREARYEGLACPFGPNFWVRKQVLSAVPAFDEDLGPRPTNRLMGGETAFLLRLKTRGFNALYSPFARVQHRIAAQECRIPALRRRGYRFGRAQTRLHGWNWPEVYGRNRVIWAAAIAADYSYTALRLLWGFAQRNPRANCETTVDAMIRFGRLNETVALFWQLRAEPPVVPSGERRPRDIRE